MKSNEFEQMAGRIERKPIENELPLTALCLDCDWEGFSDQCREIEIRLDRKLSVCPACNAKGVILEPMTRADEIRWAWGTLCREFAKLTPFKQVLAGLRILADKIEARKVAKANAWRREWFVVNLPVSVFNQESLRFVSERAASRIEADLILELMAELHQPAYMVIRDIQETKRKAANPKSSKI